MFGKNYFQLLQNSLNVLTTFQRVIIFNYCYLYLLTFSFLLNEVPKIVTV